jgi:predicted DNA-binding WGR domain protein
MTLARLKRIDPAKNIARFYELALHPTLFGHFALVHEWGRIGQADRLREDLFDNEQAASCARRNAGRARFC